MSNHLIATGHTLDMGPKLTHSLKEGRGEYDTDLYSSPAPAFHAMANTHPVYIHK